MFEIKFVIRDKHLADILRTVQAVAIEPPVIVPIDEGVRFVKTATQSIGQEERNLRVSVGMTKAHAERKAGRPDAVTVGKNWLDNNPKVVRFVPQLIERELVDNGFKSSNKNYVTRMLWKRGFLKKKSRGQYEVIRK